jgi:hypothetical protein
MKKYLPFLMVLFIGSAVLLAPGAPAALAHGGPPPWAGGRDRHDREDHGRDRHQRNDHRENRGRRQRWERDRRGRYRFDDQDRRDVVAYFQSHRDDRRFRERWRNDDRGFYPPVAYGYVIGPRYRRYCRPLPPGLVEELPPAPYGFRYFFFGGNVVLVDNGYRVQDFIHIAFNFGG